MKDGPAKVIETLLAFLIPGRLPRALHRWRIGSGSPIPSELRGFVSKGFTSNQPMQR